MSRLALLSICWLLLTAGRATAQVDFDTQIMPILTKAGCNAGACHGAAAGRGGFHLSLLGSDPARDYLEIVRDLKGRRVNLKDPAASLLLKKPTGQLDHGGDVRFEEDSREAQLLLQWITTGAPRLNRREFVRLEVEPTEVLVPRPSAEVEVRATAYFSDGQSEDVTEDVVFTVEDPASLEVDEGRIRVMRRGQHRVLLRYLTHVSPLTILVPLADEPVDLSAEPQESFIDQHVLKTLATLRIPVAPICDDHTFVRRVYLDLTGRLPSVDQVREFVAESDPAKRHELVDSLLASREFTEYWTWYLSRLFRIQSSSMQREGAQAFGSWLEAQIAEHRPIDQLVQQMLLAEGDSYEVGPANFSRATPGPREHAEFVSESLLGVRIRCANCHDHPLDRWTQDDYHGLAAIFARLDRGRMVQLGARGDVTHPRTGEPAVPRIPGVDFVPRDADGRPKLAEWMTAPENPYFARAFVNRLWKALMGRGLVEPVDDLRDTNPATHPGLLKQLADDFVAHDYNLRHTLRRIATSATYARSGLTNERNAADDRFYSHALSRPLAPEVWADAIADVTLVPVALDEVSQVDRAIELLDGSVSVDELEILGRCTLGGACEPAQSAAGGLARVLHLMNGELINARIQSPDGRLAQLRRDGLSDHETLEQLYLLALCRKPTDKERTFWMDGLAATDDPISFWNDFLWALLNSQEFRTNH